MAPQNECCLNCQADFAAGFEGLCRECNAIAELAAKQKSDAVENQAYALAYVAEHPEDLWPGIEKKESPDGKLQVSIYAVDRCFGGREEGGWYYDWNTFAGVSSRVRPEQVAETKIELLALFAEQQPRYPIDSVLSDGPEFRAVVEAVAAQGTSTVRPHYE